MSELLVVANPKRRRHRRRKLSAKQIAAGFGGKRHKRRRRHASRRRRRHLIVAAPRRRRRRSSGGVRRPAVGYTVGTKRIRRRKLNPMRRHRYRRHRNPSMSFGSIKSSVMPTVKEGFTGAIGALGLDALWGFVAGNATLGAYVSNQYVGFAAKLLGAVLIGAVGGKVMRGKGRELAVGAATVAEHDFLKALLQSMAPTIFGAGGSVPLGSYLSGAAPIVGTTSVPQSYLPFSGMGAYLSGSSGQADANGQFLEDTTGMSPWSADGRY
jgi:hypothetical protein